jgi:hypothetical protein
MPSWLDPNDEKIWQQAKEIAAQQGKENNYAFITSVFKKIKKGKVRKDAVSSQAMALNMEILNTAMQYLNETDLENKKILTRVMSQLLKELNKIGQLDFSIFVNPKFSELLNNARALNYETKLKVELPDKIVLEENVVSGTNESDATVSLINNSKYVLSELDEVPGVKLNYDSKSKEDALPIYDLCLVLRDEVKEKKEDLFGPIQPREPTTVLTKSEQLGDIFQSAVIIDKNYNTPKVFIHKLLGEVKIFSDSGKDITNNFDNEILNALKEEQRDYIIECNLSFMVGKNPATQLQIEEDIIYNGKVDSSTATQTILNMVDCLYLDKNTSDLPIIERKKLLKTINNSHHLKLAPFVYVENPEQIPNGAKLISKLLWSNGAIITKAEAGYMNRTTNSVVKLVCD